MLGGMRLFLPSVIGGLLLCVSSGSLHAQNMQVIGGDSMAQECYRASTSASLTGTAGALDLQSCSNALENGNLRKRDVIATYVNRGVINTALQNYRAAAKDYNRAIKMDPKLAEAYVNRGNLWFVASRYAEAIADYDTAMDLGFSQPHVALLNRGMAREVIGQLLPAKDDYLAALAVHKEWETAKQKLQRVNVKLEQRRLKNNKNKPQEQTHEPTE